MMTLTFSNWIELIMLMVVIIPGMILKIITTRQVSDIDGFHGVVKNCDYMGRVVSKL